MKLVATLRMLPTESQAESLLATLERCNQAATWLAATGFTVGVFRQYDLHKLAYVDVRSKFGLTAQAAVRTISKVADAFKINSETAPSFRSDAAQPYDDRIIRFVQAGAAVSIWTLEGRMVIPVVMGEHQRRLMVYRKGEVDLMIVRGKWLLAATCEIPETDEFNAEDWIGVDFGIVSIAVDSSGKSYGGNEVEQQRKHYLRRRRGLQKRGTKAAKRRLRKLSGRQSGFHKQANHRIAKTIVADAKRSCCGIALEQLKGIGSRVKARSRSRDQRAKMGNWAYSRLGFFISYKAKLLGVPVVFVDPRNTSRQCAECGCVSKRSRCTQAKFSCVSCGHQAPADLNAARNIRAKAFVTAPCVLAA